VLVHNFTDGINDVSGIRLRGNGGKSVTVRNSMIWEGDDYGIEGDELTDTLTIENCSVDGTPGWGINTQQSVLVIRNTIVTGSATADFAVDPGGSMSGSNNSSTDGSAALYFSNPQTGVTAASVFVAPNVDLHLKSGANVAVDTALNLSASFLLDIDGGSRALVTNWDRGADEREVTTAVELVSFAARGEDRAVKLSWETGSELLNLGFHVYRAGSESGPYVRITERIIPGLGSSPEGARYSYRDWGVMNGTTYFYKIEDIETTGKTEMHGPVSVTPQAGAGEGGPPVLIVHGEPEGASLRVLEKTRSHALIELVTPGFTARPREDGTVELEIPGFVEEQAEGRPAIPVKRVVLDAMAGRNVRVVSVRESDIARFSSLTPSAAGALQVVASRGGVVEPRRAPTRSERGESLYPDEAARLLSVGFQGEIKKALFESLNPYGREAVYELELGEIGETMPVFFAAPAGPVEDIFDAFGFGESRPEAIRNFLAYAYHHWRAPSLRYVLLLGDATYDFKDYLGTGVRNHVPPLLVKTSCLWTSSDPTYAAVNGEDFLPDPALRLK
jgi:hypothetical protein